MHGIHYVEPITGYCPHYVGADQQSIQHLYSKTRPPV